MRSTNALFVTIIVLIMFMACVKDSTEENLGNNVLSSENHITYVLNSDTVNIIDGINGWLNKVGAGGGMLDTVYLHREYSEFSNVNGDTIRIYFIEKFSAEPSQQEKEAMIHIGEYDPGYGTGNSLDPADVTNGVAITYKADGTLWSTELGAQNDFLFAVDSQLVNSHNTSKYFTYGRFQGTLYNANGNTLNISDASFRAITIFN